MPPPVSAVRFRGDAEQADTLHEGGEALTPEDIAEAVPVELTPLASHRSPSAT